MARQLTVSVKVKRTTIGAIVNSGANVNYINERWSKIMGIRAQDHGEANVRAYSGDEVRERIRIASVEFTLDEKKMKHQFRVLKKTGSDKMVLGIPWLREENPMIDWQKETVTLIEAGIDMRKVSAEGTEAEREDSTFNFIDSQRQNSIFLLIIHAN